MTEKTPPGLWAFGGVVAAVMIAAMMGTNASTELALPISGLLMAIVFLAKPLVGVPLLALLISLLYFGWLRPVSTGRGGFTYRTWLALLVLAATSASWYRWNWAFGIKWQGPTYTAGCAILSAAIFFIIVVMGLVASLIHRPSVALAARWLAMAWVCTYGYPWLGELL